MLRITLPTETHSKLFILEGRLAGLWTRELLRVARGANQGYGNVFDLRNVFYVDSEGEDALRSLARRGATFITESAYGKDLCRRLRLARAASSDGGLQIRNRGKSRSIATCDKSLLSSAAANQASRVA